jgi:carbon-monoxide dehydrogenase medium subunit
VFSTEFEYQRAASVAQALQLLRSHENAKVLAGGHSLIPLMKLRQSRPSLLVDIGGIAELRGIAVNNGTVRIGALTTHREIQTSAQVQQACDVMAEVAEGIGDPHVRNRGTIGGNVTHADPGSDWPTVLTALDARFVIQGQNARTLAASEFFTGVLETAVADDELLVAIEAPRLAPNQHAEYAKMAHPATSFAVVGAAVVVTVDNGRCTDASIAVGGLVPVPVRARAVENALVGQELTADNVAAATQLISEDLGDNVFGDSVYASADYRRVVVGVEIKHAIFHATGMAHGAE